MLCKFPKSIQKLGRKGPKATLSIIILCTDVFRVKEGYHIQIANFRAFKKIRIVRRTTIYFRLHTVTK